MSLSSRIVFMGTPSFAVPSLEILINSHHQVVGVITAPDKPAGRGLQMTVSAVKKSAQENNLRILQPEKLENEDFLNDLRSLEADLFIVVAFRKLPKIVWEMPRLGTVNLHASLLPEFRGAAPIQRAIMSGADKTGLTTFLIDEQIDTGRIILQKKLLIGPDETSGELQERMMKDGAIMVLETVDILASGKNIIIDQASLLKPGQILQTAPKIRRDDCRISWQNAWRITRNQIRGLSPYPGAFTFLQDEQGRSVMLKIYRAEGYTTPSPLLSGQVESDGNSFLRISCSDGWLNCTEVQLEGKRKMNIDELLRGFRVHEFPKAC